MDKKYVITIARQYGSGGRTIGQMLAKELGIEFYDRDLIKKASEDSGISMDLFAESDEKAVKKGLLGLRHSKSYGGEVLSPDHSKFTSDENLFNYQAKVIKQLAEQESCIIIGRAADYILKDYDNVLSVFVHAPKDYLLARSAEKLTLTGRELEKYIDSIDKDRAAYYKAHTGREWTDARNYDLCLDSSKLGFERCVEEIIAYMNIRFK